LDFDALDAAQAACRWVHDLALMFVFGSAAVTAWLAAGHDAGLRGWLDARLARAWRIGLAFALLAALAGLALQAAAIAAPDSGGVASLTDILRVIDSTTFGRIDAGRVILCGAAWALCARATRRRAGGAGPDCCAGSRTTAIAAGVVLASLALTGHARMQSGMAGLLHACNHAVHVLCGAFWTGGLVAFLLCMRACDSGLRMQATATMRKFSILGHYVVAAVIATGIANTAWIVGGWPHPGASAYQALLWAKILLVGGMVSVALLNRYAHTPRLGRSPHIAARATQALRRGAMAELVMAAAVLALVAVFGLLEPGTSM
jgi:putative copper resistance protein D